MDTCAGGSDGSNEGRVAQSTISRFACRILADRSDPRIARIYAAGFDSSRNIFLGVIFFTVINSYFYRIIKKKKKTKIDHFRKKQQSGKKIVKLMGLQQMAF